MFSLQKQKKCDEVKRALARIADLTTPNLSMQGKFNRSEHRQNRTLPALLVPLKGGQPCSVDAVITTTKDISGQGVSVVLSQPYRERDVIVAFWLTELHDGRADSAPQFFGGETRQCTELGGGWWQLGIEIDRIVTEPEIVSKLMPSAARLISTHREIRLADGD